MTGPRTRRPPRSLTTDAYPTEITEDDLLMIGAALVQSACSMAALGHESPAGLSDYVDPGEMPSWHARFVLDMVAHSQSIGQDKMKNDALDRIYGFVWQSGAMHRTAAAISEVTP